MHGFLTSFLFAADYFYNVLFLLMGLSSVYYIVITFVFEVTSFFYSFNERQKRVVNSDTNSNDLDSFISYSNLLNFIIILCIIL